MGLGSRRRSQSERSSSIWRATQRDDHEGYLVCRKDNDAIAGVINVNNIVRGSFLSASLGYYAVRTESGRGLMAEGLRQIVQIAFGPLGLHRLEANIQPTNHRSIAPGETLRICPGRPIQGFSLHRRRLAGSRALGNL